MRTRFLHAILVAGLTLAAAAAFPRTGACAATITIVNNDGAGEGFNDPTPVAPIGGNSGTTRGQQRLNVFQAAANYWGAILTSNVVILVRAQFDPLTCTATSAVLGSAGPLTIHRDFPGAEVAGHWYHQALANKLAGVDQSANFDINATFNSTIGTDPGCLGGRGWYYGLDGAEGADVDLLPVVLHELGHGLGFSTTTNGSTGQYNASFPGIWDRYLYDRDAALHWDQMTSGQRATSAINSYDLVWDGPATTFMAPFILSPDRPEVLVHAPVSIAGGYPSGTATFGAPLGTPGVTGTVVAALDAGGVSTLDACEGITNAGALSGNIALVDRGNCTFVTKALAAQAAGAIGIIIANNQVGGPQDMADTEPLVTIPVASVDLGTGGQIRAQLGAGVNATLWRNPARMAGSDPEGRVLMYAPSTFQGGSSVSHFDVTASPSLLMEPSITTALAPGAVDLTRYLFEDIGWFPRTTAAPSPGELRGLALRGAPNPFRGGTALHFEVARPGFVDLAVYDVGGRLVKRLANAWMPAGSHTLSWDGADAGGVPASAGVYLVRMRTADGVQNGRIVRMN